MQKCIQDSPSSFLLCGEGPQFLAALPPKNANSGRKKAVNRFFCAGAELVTQPLLLIALASFYGVGALFSAVSAYFCGAAPCFFGVGVLLSSAGRLVKELVTLLFRLFASTALRKTPIPCCGCACTKSNRTFNLSLP